MSQSQTADITRINAAFLDRQISKFKSRLALILNDHAEFYGEAGLVLTIQAGKLQIAKVSIVEQEKPA